VQAATRRRVDLGLRLADRRPIGRLESAASMGTSSVTARIGLTSVDQVDDEVESGLRRANEENARMGVALPRT
jgi:hypothetical protein